MKRIGMIAGGSGVTPMLQISRAILDNGDKVKINLLFANQTEADILCRDEIEADVAKYGKDKFSAHYTLDRPPKDWKYSSGFITKEMIQKHLPPPGKGTQILICGPPPMLKFAVLPALEELGYTKDMYLTW
jgi:cytochrome-b5 reductase